MLIYSLILTRQWLQYCNLQKYIHMYLPIRMIVETPLWPAQLIFWGCIACCHHQTLWRRLDLSPLDRQTVEWKLREVKRLLRVTQR